MMNDKEIVQCAKGIRSRYVSMHSGLSHDQLVELGDIAHRTGNVETDETMCRGKLARTYNCRLQEAPFLYPVLISAYEAIVHLYGFDIKLELTQGFLLNEYTGPSGEYPWHVDDSCELMTNIKATCIINASVEKYEGGDFHIAQTSLHDTHIPFLEEPGTAIVFRANTLHKLDPVTSGKRRSLVFFLEGPAWR